jgi:hypothetical protein
LGRQPPVLGRVPLVEVDGGLWPVAQDGDRRAAHLRFRAKGQLRKWLRRDRHLRDFLRLPSKENGLDVEGIAVAATASGSACAAPCLAKAPCAGDGDEADAKGHLKARRIEGRSRVRKHFVDTDGQGIRDMKWDGDDLLLVTGPVLSGDGPAAILRLHGFAHLKKPGYVGEAGQTLVQRLPYRESADHPEGLVRWDGSDWLVLCDSPGPERAGDGPPYIEGDVWRLG